MSYDQTFKGKYTFADAHCLEAGLDAFAQLLTDSIVDLDSLKVKGLEVGIDVDCSAPASMYEETSMAIGALGSCAKSGSVAMTFTLDGTSREARGAGRRTSSKGLPPRHYKWDVFFAAKAGDAKALR